MAEFVGDATSNQLLVLILCPLAAAVLLVGFLFFSFSRRRRKAAMKLGIQPPVGVDEGNRVELPAQPVKVGSPEAEFPVLGSNQEEAPAEESLSLNLNILGGSFQPEVSPAPSSAGTRPEQIDLEARLGGQSGPPPAAVPAAHVTSVPISNPPAEAAELLRLLRDPQTERLIVEVAGQRYYKLTDITDREVGQYILELAASFLAFSNGVVATEAGVKSVYLPKVQKTPEPLVKFTPVTQLPHPTEATPPKPEKQKPAAPPLVPPPSPEAEAAFLAALQAQKSAPPPTPAVPVRRLFGLGRSSEPAPALSQFNLAGEINQIVQARLLVSPLGETTYIEILSDHSGGIRIKVNGQMYNGPDDVPDPDVKALIKDSIKQWERM
jgi:hypothetical protein